MSSANFIPWKTLAREAVMYSVGLIGLFGLGLYLWAFWPEVWAFILEYGGAALALIFYKVFDELQDESVNSHWRRPFLGLSLDFLNKRADNRSDPFFYDQGWARKWKWDWASNQRCWIPAKCDRKRVYWRYLGLYQPPQCERFIWSSTLLVALTDGEHFWQWWKDRCIGLAGTLLFADNWWVFFGSWLLVLLVGMVKELRK